MDRFTRTKISYLSPETRIENFEEVCLGYTKEEAIMEANRCIQCKKRPCVEKCPIHIDIPAFIKHIAEDRMAEAYNELMQYTFLSGICGRACPQEDQCESNCVLGRRGEAIAIGKLERYITDWAMENDYFVDDVDLEVRNSNSKKVAVVGSGPAGVTCAGELARKGYDVTVYEALHKPGGVLTYGIPEFRLPEDVIKYEIEDIERLGVEIVLNTIIGRTISMDELSSEYDAIFVGTGAGFPKFMNIEGETLNGVYSANEFLTRNNLMKAYREDYDTPIKAGSKVAVIGGGNVSMDAARTAKRLGAEPIIIYRRTEAELPARQEEIEHTHDENIKFEFLSNPTRIIGDEDGNVVGIECIKMELGEEDSSGRRRPVEIADSEYLIDVDSVIMALGTSPNSLIIDTTEGLEGNNRDCIIVGENGETTRSGVFAGGDIVTGAATVINAMGAGKLAAKGIDEYLKNK